MSSFIPMLNTVTADDVAAAVGARVVEGVLSQDQVLRIMLAALSGKSLGFGTSIETYKSVDGETNRIIARFDEDGNRYIINLNGD